MPPDNDSASPLYRILILSLIALVIGSVVSFLAVAFIEFVSWLNDILFISPRARIQLNSSESLLLFTLLAPTLGGLLIGLLLKHGSKEGRPLGPPDAIQAVQTRSPLPSLRAGAVSTLAASLSIGCGASVGQYGPMVYLGALAGNVFCRYNISIRNLQAITIACGVAAAISTAFNAPIAGLVFAHEVILRHYSMQAFAPTTVASATGYVVANVIFESPPLFLVEFGGVQHGYEFALFAILGCICALAAVTFMQLVLKCAKFSSTIKQPIYVKTATAGLLVGIVALWLPDVLGIGKETLRFTTIQGAFEAWELLLLIVAKMLLTAICIGAGFAGGVFSPALLIGGMLGSLFWILLSTATGLPTSGVAVYAICAMMALASPVIGAPLTTILVVFELTRNYDLTIAAMVAVVFANLIAYRTFGRSLFDTQLKNRGIELSGGRDQALLSSIKVAEIAHLNYPVAQINEPTSVVIARMTEAGKAEAVVVAADNTYCGMLRLQDANSRETEPLSQLITTKPVQLHEGTTLWQAMQDISCFCGEAAPVVNDAKKLTGIVTEADVISTYLTHVHDLRREENEAI